MKKLLATGVIALALAFGFTNKADAQYFSYSVGTFPAYSYGYYPAYPVYPGGVSINYYSGSRYDRYRHHYGHGHYRHGHRHHGHGHHGYHGHRR